MPLSLDPRRIAYGLLAILTAISTHGWAQTPAGTAFDYQGRLLQGGAPADGSFDFRFTLWVAAVGGTQIGPTLDLAAVDVAAGLFNASLDFGAESFDDEARWLQIAVGPASRGGLILLAPRRRIAPSAQAQFALAAGDADTLDGLDSVAFDMSAQNELNVSLSLEGTILNLEDAGGALQVDLAPLATPPPTPPRERVATATATVLGPGAGQYEFDAYSVSWGWDVASGGSGGGTTLVRRPFTFEKKSDGASPRLRQAMAASAFLPEIAFEIENDAGEPITLTAKNCLISDIATDFDGDAEVYERYALAYSSVRLRYPDATTPIEVEINFASSTVAFATPMAGALPSATNALVVAPIGLVDAAIPAGDRVSAFVDGSSQAISFLGGAPMGGGRLDPNGLVARDWTYAAAVDFHRVALGSTISAYTFDFYREDTASPAGVRRHERIEMGEVQLDGFEIEAEEPGAPAAKVGLGRPNTILWTYYPVDPAGQPQAPIQAGWDILNGSNFP